MPDQSPFCCDFCLNLNVPLYEGGVDPLVRICGFCASQAVSQTTPQPVPEPTPPPERPSKQALLASIPAPKSLVAHLDQFVIGQDIAKRRLALGVANHYSGWSIAGIVALPTRSSPTLTCTMCELRNPTFC